LAALIIGFIRVTQLTQIEEKEKFPARSVEKRAGNRDLDLN
jgi:hypothetical protein